MRVDHDSRPRKARIAATSYRPTLIRFRLASVSERRCRMVPTITITSSDRPRALA